MANVNSGAWVRFENSGVVLIGADTLLNIVPGSLRVRERQRERIPNMDRGVLGAVTLGDQRQQEIEFQIYRVSASNTFLATMLPAATTGLETYFSLTVKVADYLGAATGQQWVWASCYAPDGFEQQAGGRGQETDRITIRLVHQGDRVAPTSY
jgi:hypothetical protein